MAAEFKMTAKLNLSSQRLKFFFQLFKIYLCFDKLYGGFIKTVEIWAQFSKSYTLF
jgi:hypothetical protein